MDKLFNMDNKFFVFMGRVADLILLNLYFVISCIPIITIGPALTALHYVTLKMVRHEETYIFRGYVKSFKENFKQGVIINIIMIVTAVLLYMDLVIVAQVTGTMGKVLYCLFLAIGIIYVMIWLYIYPILARFYNTIRNTFTNAFLMSIRHLPTTILMALISAAPIAMLFLPYPQLVNMLILVFVLCGFSLIAYCNGFLLVRVFDHYIPKKEEDEGDDTEAFLQNLAMEDSMEKAAAAEAAHELQETEIAGEIETSETNEAEETAAPEQENESETPPVEEEVKPEVPEEPEVPAEPDVPEEPEEEKPES